MIEIKWQPLSSKWRWLATQKWSEADGTWQINGYQGKCVISISEELGVTSGRQIAPGLSCKEELHASSSYWDNIKYVMRILERLNIAYKINKQCDITLQDKLNVADRLLSRIPGKTFHEQVGIMGQCFDHRIFRRLFNESFGIVDKQHHIVGKIQHEQINVLIEQMGNSGTVISDIIISTNEIPLNVPAGYEQWKPFVSGDYTYKDALIKCVLTSNALDYNVLLTSYKVFVDLPDLQDHAVTDVPAEKTYIPFGLEFYRIPDVSITTVGAAEVVIPHIVEITLEGFYVELRNTSNKLVAGKISWQALGC